MNIHLLLKEVKEESLRKGLEQGWNEGYVEACNKAIDLLDNKPSRTVRIELIKMRDGVK